MTPIETLQERLKMCEKEYERLDKGKFKRRTDEEYFAHNKKVYDIVCEIHDLKKEIEEMKSQALQRGVYKF